MIRQDFDNLDLPDNPGIYFFRKQNSSSKEGKILYVGKATSLRDRVRSYFASDLFATRGPLLVKMVAEATTITWTQTDSVLEALILEAYTIKEHQPLYNSKEKDNKSFNFVVVTDEDYPRVLIERGRTLATKDAVIDGVPPRSIFGPFPHGAQLREAVKIVRKIFPFRDKCIPYEQAKNLKLKTLQRSKIGKIFSPKACFNHQIGLCPGVCTGEIKQTEYKKLIRNIELFFMGKKTQITKNLQAEMKLYAKAKEFEKAEVIKRRLFALGHIKDVTLLKKELEVGINEKGDGEHRIEAYDIAHISGKDTVGVMVVVSGGEPDKTQYRKFKIKSKGLVEVNDIKNLKEVFERRFNHTEWQFPNILVVDGGIAQYNAALEFVTEKGIETKIVAVTKDERHKPKDFLGDAETVTKFKTSILLANGESHRFAQSYHTNLRRRPYRIG
jgi:excinuclease ABC subunit C